MIKASTSLQFEKKKMKWYMLSCIYLAFKLTRLKKIYQCLKKGFFVHQIQQRCNIKI